MSRYFYRWCKKGHLTHDEKSPIKDSRCKECGDVFIHKCSSCNEPLEEIQDCGYSWFSPDRPNNCKKCGSPFSWKPSWFHKTWESLSNWWKRVPVTLQVALIVAFFLTIAVVAGILKIDQVIKLAQLWKSS